MRGAVAAPESVLVVAGATQGLTLLARELVARGQETLAVEDPGNPRLYRTLAPTGLRLVPVPVDNEGLDVAALAATGAHVVLGSPAHQFPTGAVLSAVRRDALMRWAIRRNGLVIEDDHDAVFRWDRRPMDCLQGFDPQHVALLGSVSRPLAPGLRLGWIVPPAVLLDSLVATKRNTDGGSPSIEQHALARLIEMGAFDHHLRSARRDALLTALREQVPGWAVTGAAAGLHVWVRPPSPVDAAAVVAAAAACGLAVEATAVNRTRPARLSGLVVSYAMLDVGHADEAVARLAGAIREAGVAEETSHGSSAQNR